MTPDSLLRLQRQAGNAAVTSMLTVQRKKTQDYTDGMIAGNFTYLDRKGAPIERAQMTVTEAWFA